ncbi:MAG TPA: response regulator [Povalibacter sp.]|nr:response regulator [Povalibacter sp.]
MKKPSVLVVDDDPATLQLICSVLEANGVSCLAANGAAQALEVADAHPALGLIITDINMPQMDGLALVKRIGETPGRVAIPPVVFLTAYPSVDFAISALRLGATDFLIKPVRPVQLLAVVKRVIGETGEYVDGRLPPPTVAAGSRPTKQNDVSGRALLGIDELRNRRRTHPLLSELDDTASDLLLELLRAERASRRLSVSALSISIDNDRVSSATALRRIQNLVRAGHIVRIPDPLDARREFVSLAPETRVALELYLKQVAEAFTAAATIL